MKITRITVYRIDLPYVGGTYGWAKNKAVSVADSTVVRLDTDEGVSGWGESCPLAANYLPAFAEGVRAGVGVLVPHVIGLDPTRIGAVNRVMDHEMRGQAAVKSALDMACWDILGKASGQPLHALLGGRQSEAMPMYRAVPQGTAEEMAGRVEAFRAEGYRQFQLKVGGRPGDDIGRIRAVTESLKPGEIVLADGNTGWRRDEALQVAAATRDLHFYLEQPCEAYEDCLSVRRRARQPFKLDESLPDVRDLMRALHDDACDVASIKVSKHGGLTKARLMRDICAANGIPMTVEDCWGGDIVEAALAHLAASTPPEALLNTTDLHNYNMVHFAAGAPEARDGCLFVGDAPGLGVVPDEEVLGEAVAVYE
jgi:L-alanine-DL-glutamate epimerase-like enolase superfamily enzyme